MAVARLEIEARRPYEEGRAFGDVGPYERIDGTLHFAVAPGHPANQAIVDLDKAPRDSAGRVTFWADFCLLRPADPVRGNRRLLFDVVNRGNKPLLRNFNRAAQAAGSADEIDPGDGFLMRQGWTVAWCGWQWDVIRSPALLGLEPPQALEDGRPIQGQVAVEFQPNAKSADELLANRLHHSYPAADLDDPSAVLTVRDWSGGSRTTIPRNRWRFARDEGGRPAPNDRYVWLEDGFEAGRVYEVVYRTRVCPIVGSGLLAVRDCVAFLRHGEAASGNPCAGPSSASPGAESAERTGGSGKGQIDYAYGFGRSQTGRFLRHFLYLGLNLDEAGRQVFDGLIPLVAGERRGEFNHRFGQPSVQGTPSFGHLMPFTDDDQTDPVTGRTDGLLRRQRSLGGVPKIFSINTSAEYYRGGGSLIHTDLADEQDVEPPDEVRIYHIAGTQHGLGVVPLVDSNAAEGSRGANPFNAVDYSPLLRAALLNLDRWVAVGVEPPPSKFPRLADGTAAPARDVVAGYPRIPGAHVPAPELLPSMRRYDLGPEAGRGIGRYPAAPGDPYPSYVSAVDADGNELGGIRLPDLTVPLASYTAWNPRHSETGGAGQLIAMQGSTFPLAATAEARQRSGDPRPSIEERYRDRDDYLQRVRAAAEQLVAERYVLAEDVDLVVQLAAVRYDTFAASLAGSGTR